MQCDGNCFACGFPDCVNDELIVDPFSDEFDVEILRGRMFQEGKGVHTGELLQSSYYAEHREERIKYQKSYYAKNRDRLIEYQKKRYLENREELIAYQKLRYLEKKVGAKSG